jgi:hypothetical protein
VIGTATTPGDNQITVTWTGITPTPGAYAIERAEGACGSEGLYRPLAATAGTASSFTDTTVQGGIRYSTVCARRQTPLVSAGADHGGCANDGDRQLQPQSGFSGCGCGSEVLSRTAAQRSAGRPARRMPADAEPALQHLPWNHADFVPSVANRIVACVFELVSRH